MPRSSTRCHHTLDMLNTELLLPAPLPVIFEAVESDVVVPELATLGSVGYDLRAYLRGRTLTIYTRDNVQHQCPIFCEGDDDCRVLLRPGDRAMIPLGFKARVPMGYEAQLRPRSGTALKLGLTVLNAPGTIDPDFPHEWMLLVRNDSGVDVIIPHGERIGQAVFAKYAPVSFVTGLVTQSTNRVGGFNSTGTK